MMLTKTAMPTWGLEHKFIGLSDPTLMGETGVVSGHASLFGEPDQSGDVVMPGAYARSLDRLAALGRRVKFLWQHDATRPIGVWSDVREDGRGLWVAGSLLSDVAQGAEAMALLRAGAIDGLSIGYRTVRAEANRETGGRRLLEIDLWEVSLVTFPMLPSARAMVGTPTPVHDMELALAEALAMGVSFPV